MGQGLYLRIFMDFEKNIYSQYFELEFIKATDSMAPYRLSERIHKYVLPKQNVIKMAGIKRSMVHWKKTGPWTNRHDAKNRGGT